MRSLITIAALVCGSPAALAAGQATTPPSPTAAADAGADTGEIVVSAQKRSERLLEVPMSVSAISGEQLVANGITSTVNLQQTTPGIVTVNNGFGFLPIIRGIQSTGTSPGDETNVAVYLDDISIGTPIAGFFDLADIERIEVLKGPQGTLYGRNATGGAIKIVTRKPKFTPQGSAMVDYGFHYREIKATGYITGPITDTLAGSLSSTVRHSRGYIKGTAGNAGKYYGAANNYVTRGKLLFEPNSSLSMLLAADAWKQNNDAVFISEVERGDPQPGFVTNRPYTNAGSTEPKANPRGWGVSLDTTWSPGDGAIKVRSLTGFRNVQVQSQSDTDRTSNSIGSNQLSQYQNAFSQEVNISGTEPKPIDWLVGAFIYHARAGNPYFRTIKGDATTGMITSNFTSRVIDDALAGFADVTANLTDQLHLTGGVRYNSETKKFHWQNLITGFTPSDKKQTWNSTTWRAVARYDFSDNANVYFSASTGFKSGVYNAYSALGIPVNPEKIRAFELGAKARVAGINLSVAGYAYKYTDIQVSAYSFVGTPPALQLTLSNAAAAKMRGLEFNADGRLGHGLSFAAGIGWEPVSRYDVFKTAQVLVPLAVPIGTQVEQVVVPFDASGSRTVRTPRVTANLRVNYEAELMRGKFNGSVSTSYTSSFYWQPGNLSREAPYAVLNLRLAWTDPNRRFTYAVFGNNLTDAGYRTDYVPNVLGDSVKFGPREEYGVSVGLSF